MQSTNPSKHFEPTLEGQFKAKYSWLLRWALHFVHNDAAAAEDLVQETFVRILLLKDTAIDHDEIEPLLYTHLRYAYLTERRRGRNYAFQSLSTAEFDTLSISLRSSSPSDQIEVQNELRRILNFSLWRRRSAKFANIFLLRFFHEFTHEEIASICLTSRHAVDTALLRAREEISSYLANPQQIRIAGRGTPPDYRVVAYAVPSYDFANQTMELIFSSYHGCCPDDTRIEHWYTALPLRSLDTDQLAHVVCCKACLDKITRQSRIAPPGSGSSGGAKTLARRTGRPVAVEKAEKVALERILAAGRRRIREIYGHRPSELVIALNGEVVAVRDVSSTRSILKVESHGNEGLELIEVFSEQEVLMALVNVPKGSTRTGPLLTHEIGLSGDRVLSLSVRFSVDGALIEMSYIDPHYEPASADEYESEVVDLPPTSSTALAAFGSSVPLFPARAQAMALGWERWREGLARFLQLGRRLLPPLLAAAFMVALMLWLSIRPRDQRYRASDLLRNTVRAERRSLIAFGAGVVHQRVRIRNGTALMERDIYRDAEGHRRSEHRTETREERDLRERLAEADFDWDDPISGSDFDAWRERLNSERDEITTMSEGLLRLTTTSSTGAISQETLTVRLQDLHAVARTMTLRDHQTIEVAELSYVLEPWSPSNEKFFLPANQPVSAAPSPHVRPLPDRVLSEDELDVAALSVQLALQDLHAEAERLEVSRSPDGVIVRGIVESENRKLEIAARLRAIAHVISQVSSYSDLSAKPSPSLDPRSVVAVSAVSGDSPLDLYCVSRKMDRDSCRSAAQSILTASANLAREEMRLRELETDYPADRPLRPVARTLLLQLRQKHVGHFVASVVALEKVLRALDPDHERSAMPETGLSLHGLVEQNRTLTRELIFPSEGSGRPAQDIIRELADSTQHIDAVLPRMEQLTAGRASR